jgi:hypothetical protein
VTNLIMFDAIEVGQIPAGPQAVAGYVDGRWATAAALEGRFPHARLLTIAVEHAHDAECLDIENGDAEPADAPEWVGRQQARGIARPVLYASVDLMQTRVIPALQQGGIDRSAVRLWTAHYAGTHICGPSTCSELSIDADGTQHTDCAYGRDLDASLLVADFFGTPKPAAAKRKAPPVSAVPIDISDGSILVHAVVNGQEVVFVLDTGDAIGPVFNSADAQRLSLPQGQPLGVEGAGGASTAYQTTASITFDDITYVNEPAAIDLDLTGQSLLGLPFFLARTETVDFNWTARTLSLVPLAAKG